MPPFVEVNRRKEELKMNKDKLRYAILKEIEKGNRSFDFRDFGVDENLFEDQIRFLDNEGLIRGVFYADNKPYSISLVELTLKGEKYLEENSTLAKTYKGLKEIRDWLKL
jgi:aminopeptidase-like protein